MGNRELLMKKNQESKRVISNTPEPDPESTTLVDKLVENYDASGSKAENVKKPESKPATDKPKAVPNNPAKEVSAPVKEVQTINDSNAGRKPNKYPHKITSFSLSSNTITAIKGLSMLTGLGMNRIIELAVDEYIKNTAPEEKARVDKIVKYKIDESSPDGYSSI